MISREQQILEWIKQNPMISQNELAKLAGITRSGVAAHISNLVKKKGIYRVRAISSLLKIMSLSLVESHWILLAFQVGKLLKTSPILA
ncbi:winged helix-turn-helix transcriptional regulator [Lentilactobacillus rapi]|uniref:winged helix-turn-helix transcriptional regulator n=1 Tax=Lentilactobacillus rapi TaxID=481723 RepID=UPI000AD8FD73